MKRSPILLCVLGLVFIAAFTVYAMENATGGACEGTGSGTFTVG